MKILVTGANGYIGTGIVKTLLDKGHEVIATDLTLVNCDSRAKCIECDLFSISNPYSFFGKPDVLLHLAWRDGFVHNAISHIDDLPKHYRLIKDFIDSGIKKISVFGTMHEVGFFEGSINENTPTNPQSLYGIAKDALRKCTFLLAKNTPTTIQWLRAFYIVGNSEHGNSIFSKITNAVKKGQKSFPFTSGTNQWDFIEYEKLCEYTSLIVEQDRINGIINVCSGYPQRLADMVELFIKRNNYDIKLIYGAYPDRPYDSKAVWGDNKKLLQIVNNSDKQ